jgi:hypothetical protein
VLPIWSGRLVPLVGLFKRTIQTELAGIQVFIRFRALPMLGQGIRHLLSFATGAQLFFRYRVKSRGALA